MFGIGASFLSSWEWRGNRRIVSRVADALNARRYAQLEKLITADFVYLDTMSNPIEGAQAFIDAARALRDEVPDLMVELSGMNESIDVILVRGSMTSSDPDFCSQSLWRVRVEKGRMCEVQAFRDHNAISLPSYAWPGAAAVNA